MDLAVGSSRRPVAGRPGSAARAVRRIVRLLAAVAAAVLISLTSTTAQADTSDAISDLAIEYSVRPSGVLHVREVFDWEFGCCETKHGIQRELITREPDADHPDQDIVYTISNVTASSPDDVSTMITEKQIGRESDRRRSTVYRIGDPDRGIYSDNVTYVLEYDVAGALRHFDDHDELYWDVTGSGNPRIERLSVRAEVPGGAQQVTCFAGPIGSTRACDKTAIGGDHSARFGHRDLAAGENVTIGVRVDPGLIADNKPHLVAKASVIGPRSVGATLLALLVTIGAPVLGMRLVKRWLTDDRYLDLPPGSVPSSGAEPRVGADPGVEVPVAFTPPDIPVAEAARLAENRTDERITAATIVELAAAGVLTVERSPRSRGDEDDTDVPSDDQDGDDQDGDDQDGDDQTQDDGDADASDDLTYKLQLVGGPLSDGQPAGHRLTPAQSRFCTDVFGDNQRAELTPGTLERSHLRLTHATEKAVQERGWFAPRRDAPGTIAFGLICVGCAGLIAACWLGGLAGGGGVVAMIMLFAVASLVITLALVVPKIKRGKRSASGRAMLDQVEGFREYLSTAEAEQVKFEDGQDIFSRYLPWAIIFGLATRWQQVCQRLVELGRLPDRSPDWYASPGDSTFAQFPTITLTSTINSSLHPPPPAASGSGWSGGSGYSGGGFGSSGSSFSGGGFSGGGGGGGGSSSW
ncbi:DUF2207 domain-containing protein [Microlunatus soli]|uniref:Predicted membrane protein n=1 Tax=Microlunatus soli TaxID=630515 RepID=A0A1H1Z909_9ACTN|nr:DUF2207 domain-containing protein [Microlunatus soli]SDT30057.1 Predicted membrane protein [Microlunatus soli]